MISGIRSLSQTQEQLLRGCIGDILSSTDNLAVDTVSAEERLTFEGALNKDIPDQDDEHDKKTKYLPVWLNDKVAHGHYDGYCKQSTSIGLFIDSTIL